MKEQVRRTVLPAAEAGEAPGPDHLRAAVAELLSSRDTLTRRLLGASNGESYDDGSGGAPGPGPAAPGVAGPGAGPGAVPRRGPMPGVYKGFIG
jgi:hypothetical protein